MMLTSILTTLVNDEFKKKKILIPLLREIEKIIKILITFFYKKNFKLIINQYSKYNI